MLSPSLYLQGTEDEESKDKLSWIYENYLAAMLYTAKKYVGQHQVEEDVVHNAILKIIDNLDHIDPSEPVKTKNYVCIIVKSCAIDWLRKNKNYSDTDLDSCTYEVESTEPSPLEQVLTQNGYNKLVRCIRSLPDTYRLVCELKYIHGCKEREIADILNLTVKNVSIRIVRGRKKLIHMLREGENND